MNLGICDFPPFAIPRDRLGPTGRLSKPAWSLAVTDARENPAAARNLKKFARRWRLHRLPWSVGYQRTLKTLPGNHSIGRASWKGDISATGAEMPRPGRWSKWKT